MIKKLEKIREKIQISTKKYIVSIIIFFIIGSILGIGSKLLDIYTTNIGNMFSELSIWILFGVLISIFSKNPFQASLKVFSFCCGMLLTYYITAELLNYTYSLTFVYGWVVFTLFSPLFAYVTWYSKGISIFSKMISIGIIVITILSSVIIFDGLRIYDYIIVLFLFYYLFIKKIKKIETK